MADGFSEPYGDLLTASYDCVDRIVLNALQYVVPPRSGSGSGGDACTATMSTWTTRS